jgi:hypothetical protein
MTIWEEPMENVQFRIGTVTFEKGSDPTWGSRSAQILEHLALWAREGWQLSRLNTSAHIRVGAGGFCVLLERPLSGARPGSRSKMCGPRRGEWAA